MHSHPAPFGVRWRARWIWDRPPAVVAETATRAVLAEPVDRVVLLRRSVDLDVVPERVPCRVWADGRYVLRVNGVEVARGPVRSDPRRAHYDALDLAPHLRRGANVVAVQARHFGTATSWWMPAPPTYTLGGGGVVLEALLGEEWLVTDRSWRARAGEAWTAVPVPGDVACLPLESFDARLHPHGWDLPDFDDGGWSGAAELLPVHTGSHGDPSPPSEPFGVLLPPVRTAFPGGARHAATATVLGPAPAGPAVPDPVAQVLADESRSRQERPGGASPGPGGVDPGSVDEVTRIAFDLGGVAAGTVRLRVRGAAPGTVVDLAAAEHVDDEGRLVPLGQHAGLRYVCAGGDERFESLEAVGARHLHASVRTPPGVPAPAVELAVADRHRPRPAGASFECSDPLLERVWQVGLRTVDLCATDAYVDCPTREQRAWTGDSVVHQLVDLTANPDWSLARWHPQLAATPRADGMLPMAAASDFAADDRMFIPDWALHWVRSLRHLQRWTGDRELVAALLPVAEGVVRWFRPYQASDGLLHHVSGWVLLDWASVYSADCSSTLNALWARALEDLAAMADWVGNGSTADWARERRAEVAAAFDAFWDERRGTYVDHTVGGVQRPAAAQHGGAAALSAGIVPTGRVDRVVRRLVDRDRLVRHSFVMDTATVEGGNSGMVHLVTGYPEPEWDAVEQVVAAEPFFRSVLHDGLARAGRADLVADQCRDWRLFLDRGETTWPECWNGGTHCHGWSSTPTADLVVHTLGVMPAEPGFGSVRVAPALGDLEWARGRVPSPHGWITVEAHADGTVEVDSPVPVVRG